MIRGLAEGGAALGVAVALHLGAFALGPAVPAATAAGDGGAERVSLSAADGALAELVAAWDRPPDLAPAPSSAPAPAPPSDTAPAITAQPELSPVDISQPLPPPVAAAEPVLPPAPALAPPPEPVVAPPPPLAKPRPRAEPRPAKSASVPQPAQRAAGASGGAMAGDAGTAQGATLTQARRDDLRAGWGAAIRGRVERRKTYPPDARGAAGAVTVRLTVSGAGSLLAAEVAKSSGNGALDQAALRAVQSAAPFPAAPAGLEAGNQTFTLRMSFLR